MPRITPFLWFNDNAEEAVNFYLSVFKSGRRLEELRSDGAGPWPKGNIATLSFEIEGQHFTALNGGPHTQFNEAVSFVVHCASQQEIDYYWNALTADGGAEIQCGWLKDKFGLRWQIVPHNIAALLRPPNAMRAMMGMKKLDIAALEKAAAES